VRQAVRWEAIERLFARALDLPPRERDEFLAVACPDDYELRQDLRNLLAAHDAAIAQGGTSERFLEHLDATRAAALIGPDAVTDLRDRLQALLGDAYLIERELPSGAMSRLFLAAERSLDRKVVIKVLPPELTSEVSTARFQREVQLTAHLQHPHVLPVHAAGARDGLLYYVMPYVEGESLRHRLKREGRLPVADAVRVLREVADALAYAHRQGVVHRDIKPENILLEEGHAVLADFGIARALEAARVTTAGGARDSLTATGAAVGTPGYMAPERLAGESSVDVRSDIYALAVVGYEMLAGEPPFGASTGQAALAAHLLKQPAPLANVRPDTPPAVSAAIQKALAKRPDDRFATAADFRDALEPPARAFSRDNPLRRWLGAASAPARIRAPGARPSRLVDGPGRFLDRHASMILGVFVAGATLAVFTAWRIVARPSGGPSLSFVIEPPLYNGVRQTISDFALSADGQTVALVGSYDAAILNCVACSRSRLFLRRLSEPNAYPVPGTEDATFSAFSPNGKWLAVTTATGRLLKVAADGATAPITLASGVDWYSGIAWADDETIILGVARPSRRGLGRIAATGGAVRPLTSVKSPLSEGAEGHAFPHIAPNRKTVVFVAWGLGFVEDDFLAIGSLESGAFQTTSLLAYRPVGVVDGRILYTAGASLMAVPFDAQRLKVTGDPVRVLEDVTADDGRTVTLSSSGTLAYRRGQPSARLLLLDRDGRTQALSSDEHNMWSGGRFSPDGRRIAVDVWAPSGDTLSADIWTFDLKNRSFTRITSLGNVVEPQWTRDGRGLLFRTWFQRQSALWLQPADGSQPAKRLWQVPDGVSLFRASATPDGHGVVFCQGPRFFQVAGKTDLFYLPFAGGRMAQRLIDEPMGNDCAGRVSPDGKWLAYVATEGGKPHIFVRRFRGGGGRVQISDGNGVQPVWSRDGSRLFYGNTSPANAGSWVVAATVRATGNALEVVNRERVAALPETRVFDVTPDGDRVLVIQPSESRVRLVVTTNWLPQLRARLAGRGPRN
jgi:serine/threonine protein kinase/Tol biopolymer transport system component